MIEIFISYSQKDDKLRAKLETHLSNLRRQGLIRPWSDRAIEAGREWAEDKKAYLESAKVILLLISPDFMASDDCYDIELQRAIERHHAGTAKVIPILLRPVDWQGAKFSELQVLPTSGVAITLSPNEDAAFEEVARGIRRAIATLTTKSKRQTIHRPFPPLLPYLTDRGEQMDDLADAVEELKRLPNPKPLVCLVHGEQSQCHEMFLECLRQDRLPKWFAIKEEKPKITPYNLGWPARVQCNTELHKRLTRSLAKAVLKRNSTSKNEINDALSEIPDPVIVHTQLYTEDWQDYGAPVAAEYLRFWQEWPSLHHSQVLIVCLCIKYQVKKDGGWWKRKRFQSMNRNIQLELEALKKSNFSKFDGLMGIVLDELPSVTRTEVENWVYDTARPCWGEHWGEEILNSLINDIQAWFDDWERENQTSSVPMKNLAGFLTNLLEAIPAENVT